MGTDINLFIERKQNNIWKFFDFSIDCDACNGHGIATRLDGSTYECVECNWNNENKYGIGKTSLNNYIIQRNYIIFSILGNVKNISGYKPYIPIVPISDCRGIPKDSDDEACGKYLSFSHSASWVLLSELINYNFNKLYTVFGVISKQQYDNWDKKSPIDNYSGLLFGPDIKTITEEDLDKSESKGWTNIKVYWKDHLFKPCKRLIRVRDELKKFCTDNNVDPNDIRLVFDFD